MDPKPRSLDTHRPVVSVPRALTLAAAVVLFSALTWIGAAIRIPLQPVPITLQTLFVLLAGAILGGRLGGVSQLAYVTAGIAGVPVFAGGVSGWATVIGPTGGYLLSFAVAPLVVSALIRRSESVLWQAFVFALATMVIFALGVAHLAAFFTHDLSLALQTGLLPFLPGAAFKIVAAVSIYRSYSALRSRAR